MSCNHGPGVTHYMGCDCWEEAHRLEKEALHARIKELEDAALRRVAECADHVKDVERETLDRAARAMQPMLRSMISRTKAARLILSCLSPTR